MSDSEDILASVSGLKAGYGERLILDGVNLSIHRGEIIAIIGGSGSGKTTLLKSFIGLLRPLEGRVELFGRDYWSLDEVEREGVMKRIGVLFQNGALLGSKTLRVNVAIPLEQHTGMPDSVIERVVRLKLRQVGLEGAGERLPSELSGGMRKRASLARALALDPELLFCDEPSAGLDPETAFQLDELLLELRRTLNISIAVVTHEVASIRRIADRIAYLQHGNLIFVGSLDEAAQTGPQPVLEFFKVAGHRLA